MQYNKKKRHNSYFYKHSLSKIKNIYDNFLSLNKSISTFVTQIIPNTTISKTICSVFNKSIFCFYFAHFFTKSLFSRFNSSIRILER